MTKDPFPLRTIPLLKNSFFSVCLKNENNAIQIELKTSVFADFYFFSSCKILMRKKFVVCFLWMKLTSLTALAAASLLVKVTKAYPRLVPVMGSIISRKSQIVPHFSNSGISSSSYISFGIFPQNTSQPLHGFEPDQFGGGPPYFLCPVESLNS